MPTKLQRSSARTEYWYLLHLFSFIFAAMVQFMFYGKEIMMHVYINVCMYASSHKHFTIYIEDFYRREILWCTCYA